MDQIQEQIEILIREDETLIKFFSGKALLELKSHGLSLKQISDEILQQSRNEAKTSQSQEPSSFEHLKNLALKVFMEMIESIRSLENQFDKVSDKRPLDHEELSQTVASSAEKTILMVYLEELNKQFEINLSETAAIKTRKAERVAFLKDSTSKLEKQIEKLKEKHDLKADQAHAKINPKVKIIQSLPLEMSASKKKCDDEIFDVIHEGNIKIISKTGTKLALVKEVKSFLKSSEAEFKEDQRKLLADIQKLKDQKLKAEQALETTLKKFDFDVGSRANELEKLRKEMKGEQKSFEAWQGSIAREQKIAYDKMMLEKEEEELLEIESKLKELREKKLGKKVLKKWRSFVKQMKFLKSTLKKGKGKKRR